MPTASACPSSTSSAAGSAAEPRRACACWLPRPAAVPRVSGSTRSPRRWTGSPWHGSTLSSGGQAGRRSSLKLLSLLRDEDLIRQAREEAAVIVGQDPGLSRYPALAAAISDLLGDRRAEFLDKT